MAQQFRTTVSAVFWSENPEEANGIVAAIKSLLADKDQAATLASVEFIADGPPPREPQ